MELKTKFIKISKNFEEYTYSLSIEVLTHYGEIKQYINGHFSVIANNAKEAKENIMQMINDNGLLDEIFEGSNIPYDNLNFFRPEETNFKPF